MRLKKVIVDGFKSFFDEVEIRFSNGNHHYKLIGIVGPNGSGKSNISDAVKWCLGELGRNTIRARTFEDVIFNGNNMTKNYARVEVVFDNSNRKLDIDTDEVSIKRVVYRDGESEYYINNNPARLKDIKNLLKGTGVGDSEYYVISQGNVDHILSASPSERYKLFLEAAGVSQYILKREEALKDLNYVMEQIKTFRASTREVQSRIDKLLEDKKKLEAFKELKFKFNSLHIAKLKKEKENLIRELKNKERILKEIEEKINRSNESSAIIENEIKNIKNEVDELTKKHTELLLKENNISSKIELIKGKINDSRTRISNTEAAIQEKEKALGSFNIEFPENLSSSNASDIKNYLDTTESEVTSRMEELIKERKDIKQKLAQTLTQINELTSKKMQEESNREHTAQRINEYESDLKDTNSDIDETKKILMQIDIETKKNTGIIEELTNTLNALKENFENEKKLLEDIKNKKEELERNAGILNLKIESIKKHNPYYMAASFILTKKINGVAGMLGDLIEVNQIHKSDVVVALGNNVYGIVVDTLDTANRVLNTFREEGYGIIKIFIVSEIKNIKISDKSTLISISSLIRAQDEAIKHLVDVILDGVYISKDIIVGRGVIEYAKQSKTDIIELDEIKEQLKEVESSIENENKKILEKEKNSSELYSRIHEIEEEIKHYVRQLEKINTTQKFNALHLESLNVKKNGIIEKISNEVERLSELDKEISELTKLIDEKNALVYELNNMEAKLESEIQSLNTKKIEMARIRGYIFLKTEIEKMKQEIKELENEIKTAEPELLNLNDEISRVKNDASKINAIFENKKLALAGLENKKNNIQLEKENLISARSQVALEIEKINSALTNIDIEASKIKEYDEVEFNPVEYETIKTAYESFDQNINWAAEEELKELNNKKNEYALEIQDLEKSKNDLKKIIKENDTKAQEKLAQTISIVQENFVQLLKQMFEVADGRIEILDKNENGEYGIEVFVNIAGKNALSLNQYSGGERSMIAIALLLAFFTANPAPFAILDEGDSALDEPNVLRFSKLLRYISATYGTQFIVITHNKRTIENLECIYGVTMNKNGCSRVLSVDTSKEKVYLK